MRRPKDSGSKDGAALVFEACVGRGGTSKVWRCRWGGQGHRVALKILEVDEVFEDQCLSEFAHECEMLRQSRHANIISFLWSFVGPAQLWLFSEYCAGGSLSEIVHRRAKTGQAGSAGLPAAVLGWVAAEALAGLAHIHELGRAHRDIKGPNLLLTLPAARVKLADFGLADQVI